MNSLLQRELMADKVQMIYMDPPYGIKFSSNFQPRIDQRDVKDDDESLTREPEQIKAYRDTWTLGVHSYLSYLRDRLTLCREMLHESGSIFVQINDENLHRVRCLMDEVFGEGNFVATIVVRTRSTSTSSNISVLNDFLLWYAKQKSELKYRQLYSGCFRIRVTIRQSRLPACAPACAEGRQVPHADRCQRQTGW